MFYKPNLMNRFRGLSLGMVIVIGFAACLPVNQALAASKAKAVTKNTKKPKNTSAKPNKKTRKAAQPNVRKKAKSNPSGADNKPAAGADDGMLFAQDADNAARERADIQKRLVDLRQQIAAGEAVQNETRDQLRSSEEAISEANRRLKELTDQDRTAATQLTQLQNQQTSLSGQMVRRQEQLAAVLHSQYVSGGSHPVKALLNGQNPNVSMRQLSYLGYLASAQANLVGALRSDLQSLNQLQTDANSKRQEISTIAKAQADEQEKLVQQAAERKRVLQSVSAQVQAQRQQAQTLERDQQRLGALVEQISKMIAQRKAQSQRQAQEQQALKAQREATARAQAHSPNSTKADPAKPEPSKVAAKTDPESAPADSLETRLEGAFEKRKGAMRLPVRGEITGRFGGARPDGGPAWKGIFIRAKQGTPVYAVAAGRVMYAEYLRGFGNLMMVDHGSQFLAIYGNNEALLKHAGDPVRSGEAIATVGDTGGNPEPGLYFELRRNGTSVDPLAWASPK